MRPTLILTADPDFADLAQAELRQARPGAQFLTELAPGVWTASVPDGFTALAEQWRGQPPVFVRHICPVQATVELSETTRDVTLLERAVKREFTGLVEPELPFSVQTRIFSAAAYKPFDVNSRLSDAIQTITGAPLDVRNPVQILSVGIATSVAYVGISLAEHNLSDWAGGERRFAREKGLISRAEFKLLEALEVFPLELPPRGMALDLGAAPGGWTRVLRQHEQYVTAVDPADLHPSLQADPKVRHKRMTAERYLAEGPDTFDVVVNDMRLDARDSARLMVAYAPYLYPHGVALITFKLPEEGRQMVLDHAFNILRQAYDIAGARQLFHNRSEITVYLKPLRDT
ncbi:MAG TPA: SAM-dependent methyltransferase [Anaerolineae bacterium]